MSSTLYNKILKNIDSIYKQAIKQGALPLALRCQETSFKIYCVANKPSMKPIANWSAQELNQFIEELESLTKTPSQKGFNQGDQSNH